MSAPSFTTVFDWSARFRLSDQDVLFHSKTSKTAPRITIGMPTYRRADTLSRALAAVSRQTMRDFVIVVSDNAGIDANTVEAVERAAPDLPEIYLLGQQENLGAMANINLLLGLCETEYFMWLADDDEITENYLEELVHLLDADSSMPSAQGRWRRMENPEKGDFEPQLLSTGRGRAGRIFRYVAFGRDDTLFYGLHRASALRASGFSGFWWPNTYMLTNWCYVFLFDLIWQGPIGYSPKAAWISHNYTDKQYQRAHAFTLKDRLKTLARRMNVYWMYCAKTASRNPLMLGVTIPAAMIGFVTDVFSATFRIGGRLLRRLGGRR